MPAAAVTIRSGSTNEPPAFHGCLVHLPVSGDDELLFPRCLVQCFDPRQFLARQELERGTAAGRDMSDLVATPARRTAATESPPPTMLTALEPATALAISMVPPEGCRSRRPHRPVPDDQFGALDLFRKGSTVRADVESHHLAGRIASPERVMRIVMLGSTGESGDMVDRQDEMHPFRAALASVSAQVHWYIVVPPSIFRLRCPWPRRNVYAMAPPIRIVSALVTRWGHQRQLVTDPGAAEDDQVIVGGFSAAMLR